LPPRPEPPRRAWRIAIVAAALAAGLATAPARAQEAAPDALRLSGSDPAAPTTPTAERPADPAQAAASADGATPGPEHSDAPKAGSRKIPAKSARRPALVLGRYPKAQRAGLPGGPPAADPALTPPPSVAALPSPPARRKRPADDKPFDPVGIGIGGLRLLPFIEEDGGYASNPDSTPGKAKGSAFESTQVGLAFQSDWARHELRGDLTGGYADYFSARQANAPNGSGAVDGRLDVARDLAIDGEGRFSVVTQTPGAVTLPTGVALATQERPLVETFGATLGATQKFGDLALALHGTLDRTDYQNATLADGSIAHLASDDFNDWGLRARASYQISPIVTPFVEAAIDARAYDAPLDFTGYARSSTGALARAGATLALTGQLTGEASLGYGERQYRDARLPDLRAPLLDASLIWSPTALTTVTLKTATSLADTTNAGDSGAVSRSYTIDVAHALRRYFTLGASAGYATDVYAGAPLHDSTFNWGVHADYDVTRDIVLRASASRALFSSSAPGSNYAADIFLLGLRLQR
jgi:hypothetical protein